MNNRRNGSTAFDEFMLSVCEWTQASEPGEKRPVWVDAIGATGLLILAVTVVMLMWTGR